MRDGEARLVVVLQPVTYGSDAEVVPQIAGDNPDKLAAILAEIQSLTSERSVFRGQVISFGPEVFRAPDGRHR